MKKKLILIFVNVLIGFTLYAQNKQLTLVYTIESIDENSLEKNISDYELFIGAQKSKYYLTNTKELGADKIIKSENLPLIKDLKEGYVYEDKSMFGKQFFIQDTLSKLFKWKLIDDCKTILGYECFKAETPFRGRVYEVWYTPEIPIQNGPYKFHGLPGLILEVKRRDVDKYSFKFHCIAKEIKFSNQNEVIKNPYKNKSLSSFQDFKNFFTKLNTRLTNYTGEDGTTTITISSGYIEYWLNE
ncbi:GLPGLI family protein [Mesonia mobilis]|uniref:GLPGLI family protein n=1 Tax=Mesonia mobilis TaxID=369791 RepID=UPI0026ED0221|nr:GLPGLI family protein [Mesonia mobilis]